MTKLAFKPMHFNTHPLNDDYSYATAFVYSTESWDLVYVMERIDKTWHYTRWADVPVIELEIDRKKTCAEKITQDLVKWCRERNISPFVKKYRETIIDFNGYIEIEEDFDIIYRDPVVLVGDIVAVGISQNSHRNSNAFSVVYNTWPKGHFKIAYKVERKKKNWLYGRWSGPHVRVGTIGECRRTIRKDFLDKSK